MYWIFTPVAFLLCCWDSDEELEKQSKNSSGSYFTLLMEKAFVTAADLWIIMVCVNTLPCVMPVIDD